MKLPNKYIAIDIETTDADAGVGDVIQIGAVVLNQDLSMGNKFSTYINPTSTYRNERAMEVNKISEKTLEKAPSPEMALNEFEKWVFLEGGERPPLLAAWGTYFDVTFLRAFYKRLDRAWPFSYRCLDLKSIAIWEEAKKGHSASGGLNKFLEFVGLEFKGQAHDALDDIINTVRIIQSYE